MNWLERTIQYISPLAHEFIYLPELPERRYAEPNTKKKVQQPQVDLPKGRNIGGQIFADLAPEADENSRWELLKEAHLYKRSTQVTQYDMAEINASQAEGKYTLKVEKYYVIKFHFAAAKKPHEASELICEQLSKVKEVKKEKIPYKPRLVKYYYEAMKRAEQAELTEMHEKMHVDAQQMH